jgi:hypothetical protein
MERWWLGVTCWEPSAANAPARRGSTAETLRWCALLTTLMPHDRVLGI